MKQRGGAWIYAGAAGECPFWGNRQMSARGGIRAVDIL